MTDLQLNPSVFEVEDEPVMTRREELDFLLGDYMRTAEFTQEDRETVIDIVTQVYKLSPDLGRKTLHQIRKARRHWEVIHNTLSAVMFEKEQKGRA